MAESHRVLIIGVGSIGERHLRCFQQTGRCAPALCETNAGLREQIAQRYSVKDAYDGLDSMPLDRFDAAVICTPAPLHIPMARRLVEAGLHVLIEKPLSIGLDGIDELKQLLHEKQRVGAVAYVHRANPLLAQMKQALDEGRFGEPMQVVSVSGQHFPTFRPAYREIYYNNHATGGGAIQDALTHALNAGEWLVGPIERLAADAAHQVLDGVDVEDTVHVLARHGRVLGNFSLNQFQAPAEFFLQVNATQGSCRYEPTANRWRWMHHGDAQWQEQCRPDLERDTGFIAQANAFLNCLEGRCARPLCTIEEGEQTLRVNLAALRSVADEGKFTRV
ncbi:MAG: Gfo/Idh/MocA family protein [Phycisphaeraceae bacterium]